MPRRHIFSSSRFNRDRRADAFARAIIGEAERRRRIDEAKAQECKTAAREAVEEAECEHCGKASCDGKCPQYYEALRDQMEEWNADDR